MLTSKLALTAGTILAGSLNLSGSFIGCCDDEKKPEPSAQNNTNNDVDIDVADIVKNKPAGEKVIFVSGQVSVANSAGVKADTSGAELLARMEFQGAATFLYVGNLVKGKHLGQAQVPGGTQETSTPPGTGPFTPATPQPRPQYRLFQSRSIETQIFSPYVVQTIESGNTPLRVAYSLPAGSFQEFQDLDIVSFWFEALDQNGNNVIPAGAKMISTDMSEWPITSHKMWPDADLPVMTLSFDIVNADDSMITPTQLGCDFQALDMRVGMSTSNSKANWDFAHTTSLWRSELDNFVHVGDGGLWMGWHATSFDNLPATSQRPEILSVTDLNGNAITKFSPGDMIQVTVDHGFVAKEIEASVGGYTLPILRTAPGAGATETIYTFSIPAAVNTGPQSLFFRNMGATMARNGHLVGQVFGGFDYTPVTVN